MRHGAGHNLVSLHAEPSHRSVRRILSQSHHPGPAQRAHWCPCYYHCPQVCTIHQPNSDITDNFDDYLLLSAGRAVYGGVWAGAVDFFAEVGYRCAAGCSLSAWAPACGCQTVEQPVC